LKPAHTAIRWVPRSALRSSPREPRKIARTLTLFALPVTPDYERGARCARWGDVDFNGRKVVVRRAVSANVEASSTKSRRAREVPLPDQAAEALLRLASRNDFIAGDDYVFTNRFGRRLDGSALRRRFERARAAAGLRPLRLHDLRHTCGSLLVAGGVDLASVKSAMGHSRITTTERYLHARSASELADRFTRALGRLGSRYSVSAEALLPLC
jgi:integrase